MDSRGDVVQGGLAWSVGALLLAVSDALAARLGAVTVRGEISGLTRAASGHCYFTLKDASGAAASLRCVMFRRAVQLAALAPADGQQVQVRGRLAVYEPRGDLQFVVESLERVGAGSLYEEFLRLRARLSAEGLFEPGRKRMLPPDPVTLGIVTSLGAAALHDVLTALARRAPQVRAVIYPCLVQGSEAPATIVQALATAARRQEAQVLLLVRGGGSLEDLWSFNDERVVRAVAACPIPVVCGVGHETDVTLADLAADLRAPTPTAAAELAAPARQERLAQLDRLGSRLLGAGRSRLERCAQALDLLAHRFVRPAARLAAERECLRAWQGRLPRALAHRLGREQADTSARARALTRALEAGARQADARLAALQARLEAAHPQQVLRRGFAWLEDAAGQAIPGVRGLSVGQAVQAVMADGRAGMRVEDLPGPR
ncbi:MAG: exodeoxyribonuclease VII large subunit [Rubrivivax sp.]